MRRKLSTALIVYRQYRAAKAQSSASLSLSVIMRCSTRRKTAHATAWQQRGR